MKRYYPEADGGDFWTGHYWSRNPKTYYVVDELGGDPIDCESWVEAKKLAKRLNEERLTGAILFNEGDMAAAPYRDEDTEDVYVLVTEGMGKVLDRKRRFLESEA